MTIVTPFYNAADCFEPTACSVLCQSFQQWEWLIVDDGSTDADSLAMLDRYDALDPRIRAGIEVLMLRAGITPDDLGEVLLAGAFGNFIRPSDRVVS